MTTQDGYDWPTPHAVAPALRPGRLITARELAQTSGVPLRVDSQGREYIDSREFPPRQTVRCAMRYCHCAKYSVSGRPSHGCENFRP